MAKLDADVIVVGGGNAAFSAALAAQEQGASVLMLEAAPEDESGGTSRFTAGSVRVVYNGVDDIKALVAALEKRGITCGPLQNQGWGVLTQVTLPGGGKLGIYEPRHARPKAMRVGRKTHKSAPPAARRVQKTRGPRAKGRRLTTGR